MNISNFSFSDEFKKKTQEKVSRRQIGKLRLDRIQEICGNRIVDRKTILVAAGFNETDISNTQSKTYAKAMSWLYGQTKRGVIERVPTTEIDEFNRPIHDYRLVFVPKGNRVEKKEVEQKTYTTKKVKPVIQQVNTKKYSIQITISTGAGQDTGTFDFNDITKDDFIKKAETLLEVL